MSGTSYTPKPGSAADRAMSHLRTLEPRAELSSAALAEAIGVGSNGLAASMEAAVGHGVVYRRTKGGHPRSPTFWSLHDHRGSAADTRADTRADTPPGTAAPARLGPGTATADPLKLRFALWSDGTFELRRGDALAALLPPDETRELVRYLERLAETAS